MATQAFASMQEIASARSNLSFINNLKWTGNISQGTTLYSNEDRTLPIGSYANLGIVDGPRLWYVKTNMGTISEPPILLREKYVAWQIMFLDGNVAKAIDEMNQIYAAGVRAVRLVVSLDAIYWDKTEWDADSSDLWTKYDALIAHANTLFDKISIRVVTYWDDSKWYILRNGQYGPNNLNPNPLFNLFTEIAQDQWKVPMRVKGGVGHASMANIRARGIMTAFALRVIKRYKYLGSKFNKVSVNPTPDQETGEAYSQAFVGDTINGGWIDNGVDNNGNPALYDYSDDSTLVFQETFLPGLYENDIRKLNTAYGTTYNYTGQKVDFKQVPPPKIAAATARQSTMILYQALFNTQQFQDWHEHNFQLHWIWWTEVKAAIKAELPHLLFVFEPGGFRDPLAPFRLSSNLPRLSKLFDVLKTGIDTSNWANNIYSSAADIARTNWPGQLEKEVNKHDVSTQGGPTETNAVKEAMRLACIDGFLNGCDVIDLIDDNQTDNTITHGVPIDLNNPSTWTNQFPKTLELATYLIGWLEQGNGYNGVTINNTQTINQDLKSRVRNLQFAEQQIVNAGGSINNRINVILTDNLATYDTGGNPGGGGTPIPSDGKSEFTFVQQSSGQALPSGKTGNGYIAIDLPSHSRVASPVFTTPTDSISQVEYWIKRNGETIVHLYDTLSGFHPVFFTADEVQNENNSQWARFDWVRDWIENFVPFGVFPDALSRGNNHFPFYQKYFIANNVYKLEVKNVGNMPIRLQAGMIRVHRDTDIDTIIPVGQNISTFDLYLDINANDPDDNYKLNFNSY